MKAVIGGESVVSVELEDAAPFEGPVRASIR